MKNNQLSLILKRSILFALPILITSCGGGTTIKATDGSKIQFKSENVSCKKGFEYNSYKGTKVRDVICTANGVRTFLSGAKSNFSQTKTCLVMNEKGKEFDNFNWDYANQRSSIACSAAIKLGKSK